MKTLGVNISHDSSAAVVEDGELKHFYYEDRARRLKYFSPDDLQHKPSAKTDSSKNNFISTLWSTLLHKIDQSSIDNIAFSSYDRRGVTYEFTPDEPFSRKEQQIFTEDFSSKQLSNKRLKELSNTYPFFNSQLHSGKDPLILGGIANNSLDKDPDECFFDPELHHEHHAECGYYFSPWYKTEPAIAVVWDGGGAQSYFDLWPGYQEIDTIWYLEPGKDPYPLFKRLSNSRALGCTRTWFDNHYEDSLVCKSDARLKLKGVDVEFVSYQSSGMMFSLLCHQLDLDPSGRAPGKIMGYASYSRGSDAHWKYGSAYMSQLLQEESLVNSLKTIQKAVDYKPDVKNIVLSGGYSLNCTNNYKYLSEFPDHQIFVDPIAHDGGTAVGAALMINRKENGDG